MNVEKALLLADDRKGVVSNGGDLDPQTLAWLTDRRDALRGLLRRSARDLVEIGQVLAEVQAVLTAREFAAFAEGIGLSRATAYRFVKAAERAGGVSQLENIEPSAIYALTADNTPEEVRSAFFQRAEEGQPVTLAAVRTELQARRGPTPTPRPNLVERMVDAMVDAEANGIGTNWRGKDTHASDVQREIGRYHEDARLEVAEAVNAWGRACVAAAASYLTEEESA